MDYTRYLIELNNLKTLSLEKIQNVHTFWILGLIIIIWRRGLYTLLKV